MRPPTVLFGTPVRQLPIINTFLMTSASIIRHKTFKGVAQVVAVIFRAFNGIVSVFAG